MYALCWASLSLLAVAWLATWFSGQGLRFERHGLPERCGAGEALPLRAVLTNQGRLAKLSLVLLDAVENLTLGTRLERRVLVSWLPAGESLMVEPPAVAATRGRVRFGPVKLRTGDPVGLFQRERSLEPAATELLVHPRLLELDGLRGAGAWGGQAVVRARASEGMEFRNLRDYQFGDDLRHLDWKATARTGELLIREYERPVAQNATLVLDLCRRQLYGRREDGTLEQSVSLAASLAVLLRRMGYTLRLLAEDEQRLELTMPPGTTRPAALLDALAEVRGVGQTDVLTLLELDASRLADDRLLVLLTADNRPALADWLVRTRGAGRQKAVVVLYDAVSFAATVPPPEPRPGRRPRDEAPPPSSAGFTAMLAGTAVELAVMQAGEDQAARLRTALGGRV